MPTVDSLRQSDHGFVLLFGPGFGFRARIHATKFSRSGSEPRRDFFSYACARLSGFLWSDYFSLPPNYPARVLYKVRLGQLAGDLEEVDGTYVRYFQHGVAVVNPLEESKRVQIRLKGMKKFSDVYNQKVVEVSGDFLVVDIPKQAGRVFSELGV